jgi:hypothetical protein
MAKYLVREDTRSLFIRMGDGMYHFRPGPIDGYDHAYDMSGDAIQAGTKVEARHVGGTVLCEIKMQDGSKRRWAEQGEHDRQAERAAAPRMSNDELEKLLGIRPVKLVRAKP